MRRVTFDRLMVSTGMLLTAVLVVAGSLLAWGSGFIDSAVHSQLAAQKIYFPPASAFLDAKVGTEITPSMIPVVSQYAGQQLTTGAQAEVWADHFIAVHLQEIGGGQTYAEVSTAAMEHPSDATLKAESATLFQGETLRGLLLTSYAFWQEGRLAGDAALAAFILAGMMLILVGLGVLHLRRTPPTAEI